MVYWTFRLVLLCHWSSSVSTPSKETTSTKCFWRSQKCTPHSIQIPWLKLFARKQSSRSRSKRLSIIKDIAKGLTFLHQSLPHYKVPHDNIEKSPEYAQVKKLSHKADDYCFGIIILEIITGRGRTSSKDDEIAQDLSNWVRMVMNNDWSTNILDVEIVGAREGHNEMLNLTEVAIEYTDTTPEKRPKMSDVLQKIKRIEQNQRQQSNWLFS